MNKHSSSASWQVIRSVGPLVAVLFLDMVACAQSKQNVPEVTWTSGIGREIPAVPLPKAMQPIQPVEARAIAPVEPIAQPLLPMEGAALTLDDLIRIAIERNPRLARASFAVDAAEGKRIQAGLYPNPVLSVTGDELGDRTGPGGIWTAPQFNQEIVTGRKLSLSQAVAAFEVDQASLAVLNERYAIIGSVRAVFYEAYALQRREEILSSLATLAEQSVDTGKKLKGNIPRLDLIQLEVQYEQVLADRDAVRQELPGAYKRLAAVTGDSTIAFSKLDGSFELSLPNYDLQRSVEIAKDVHPEVRSAKVGVDRAQTALRRAQVEPIPNISLSSGYTRQNQNRSSDWMIGVSLPIPTWNRNQGNIRSAQADIGMNVAQVGRVQNELVDRLATAYRLYAAAKQRAERYRSAIIPRAEETFKLSSEAFKGGQFEYLRVLQAQRSLIEARLEFNRSLGDAWKAAGEISGLLLEEVWPPK